MSIRPELIVDEIWHDHGTKVESSRIDTSVFCDEFTKKSLSLVQYHQLRRLGCRGDSFKREVRWDDWGSKQ